MPRHFLCSFCIYSTLPIKLQKNGRSFLQWRKQTRKTGCFPFRDWSLESSGYLCKHDLSWTLVTGWASNIRCHNRLSQTCSGVKAVSYFMSRHIKINHSEGASPFSAWTVTPPFWRILTLMTDLFFSIRKKNTCQCLCLLTDKAVQRILKRSILGNYTY